MDAITARSLQPRPVSDVIIRRPRLALPESAGGITEVWACAGAGKTTLLSLWARELQERNETPLAWVSLPAAGASRPPLAALVLASLDLNTASHVNRALPQRIPAGPAALPLPARDGLPAGGGLPGINSGMTLVLDDVHHLKHQSDADWLLGFIESRPSEVHIILAGRSRPQSLAHLGHSSGMTEYGSADLAFTPDETAAFFSVRGVRMLPAELDAVHARTAGWAAALTLLSGSFPETTGLVDSGPGCLDFEPGHRATADYLVSEILDLLPEYQRDVLFAASVVDEITARLAAALTRRPDAGAILNQLDEHTGLLARGKAADGTTTYTFHPVLLRYLRTEYRRRDLTSYAVALGSAAQWQHESSPAQAALTPKEREILKELPPYQTVQDIAGRLGISPNTVKTHLRSIYQKLGAAGRSDAVQRAFDEGLL